MMSLPEKKWWKKLWGQKEHSEKVDVIKDIQAVQEFLQETKTDLQQLSSQLDQLEELEKERKIIHQDGVLQINLETQAAVLDKLMERYQFFQDDMAINGLRLKRITEVFLKEADQAGLKDLVKEKKKKPQWQWGW